ncbi:copper resistance CopC family protein [Subtercola sp. YIM 133946]|uniref:copper resistance CopC family protein n=1 Tax=Subtercola sp. YIM 133946 TaxID=3118909 RepID=UPI002F94F908
MRSTTPETRRLLALGLLAGLVLAGVSAAAPAVGRDTVVSSSPYNGQVVTKAIDTVTVTFSDALSTATADASGFAIEVTDLDGGHHESGCVSVDGADAYTDVALGDAGEYEVTWKVVTADGHPLSGTYSFVWQPTSVTMAAPAFDQAPVCGTSWSGYPGAGAPNPTDAANAQPLGSQAGADETSIPEPTMTILSAVPAVESDDSGLALPVAIGAGIAALAAISAVLLYVIRRSHGDGGTRS